MSELIYDSEGALPSGVGMVHNATGRPERVDMERDEQPETD